MKGGRGYNISSGSFQYPDGPQVPATYSWSFDGNTLTFTLYGVDLRDFRNTVYETITYLYVEKSREWTSSQVGGEKFPTGRFVSEDGLRVFEYDMDGNWHFFDGNLEHPAHAGKYVTNGNDSR